MGQNSLIELTEMNRETVRLLGSLYFMKKGNKINSMREKRPISLEVYVPIAKRRVTQ